MQVLIQYKYNLFLPVSVWPLAIVVFAEIMRWPYRAMYHTVNPYFFQAAEVAIKLLKFLFLYDQLILQWRYMATGRRGIS